MVRENWDIIPSGRIGRSLRGGGRGLALATLSMLVTLVILSGDAAPPAPSALSSDPGAPVTASPFEDVRTVEDRVLPTTPGAGSGSGSEVATATPAVGQSASAGQPPTPAGQPPKGEDVPGEWIVQLNNGESASAVAAEHASEEDAEVHEVYTAAIDGYSASMSDEEALAVAGDPRVASVTRDRMVHATAQTTPPGISRSSANGIAGAVSGAADVNADIAVLDSGIANHPDLNYRAGKNCINSSNPPTDDNGHGTHVAGSAAARDNGDHVVGVAPGARVWAVKVLNSNGSGTFSQIICGLNWVAQNAGTIEVATMSLGGGGSDSSCGGGDSMHNAICSVVNAGVPVTVAAGNDAENAANHVPAAYDEVITVSAYADYDGKPGGTGTPTTSCNNGKDDQFASFSNSGPDVDITAPGVCIRSTSRSGSTTTMSGTSMATPHVAGAVAAYMAKFGKVSPSSVKNALQSNGTTDWTGDHDIYKEPALNLGFLGGTGLVNGGSTPTTTSPPTTTAPTTTTPTTAPASSITITGLVRGTYDSGTKSKVKVTWQGAAGSRVDVYRDNVKVQSTANDGVWTDRLGFKAAVGRTFVYRVCTTASTPVCSADRTVTFP